MMCSDLISDSNTSMIRMFEDGMKNTREYMAKDMRNSLLVTELKDEESFEIQDLFVMKNGPLTEIQRNSAPVFVWASGE